MKILLPVDGSPAALAAVRHALRWREAGLNASFVLINVQEPPSLYEVVVAHEAAGAEWESEVAGGEPANLLVELLENYGCDAVVVGLSRGSHVGGVTLALLQHAPVPVTVVREPSEPELAQGEAEGNAEA